MDRGLPGFISLFLAFAFATISAGYYTSEQASDSITLELLHRHWTNNPSPSEGSTQKFFQSDFFRGQRTTHKLASALGLHPPRRQAYQTPQASIPISSAADDGISQYYTTLTVGNPGTELTLIADTGSHLTWTLSSSLPSSFPELTCLPNQCGQLQFKDLFQTQCFSQTQQCQFHASYSDGTEASGYFVNGSISLPLGGGSMQMVDVPLGGAASVPSTFGRASGVMGLGVGSNSIVDILDRSGWGWFSYCLVDHLSQRSLSSYITFSKSSSTNIPMSYTQLGLIDTLYAVQISYLSLNWNKLPIDEGVWSVQGGAPATALDTGSSLTFLVQPALVVVQNWFKAALSKYQTVASFSPMNLCADVGGDGDDKMPRLRIHFAGGAVFSPPVKSYLIRVKGNVMCLGILASSSDVSVIGGIMQQLHFWQFDLDHTNLGFAPSVCSG